MGQPINYPGGVPEPILVTLGDISFSQHWVITPTGPHPMRGTVWTVQNMTHPQETMSTAGIVLAVVFVWFCLLGLLFLLMKDTKLVGYTQVTVQGEGFYHSTMIPAYVNPMAIHEEVNYARSLAAAA